jgi:thiol-disulfide isomerase/thioredoxin
MYVSMATWCPSCKKHLPELRQLRSLFDSSLLEMIGVPVSDGDDAEKLSQYVEAHQPPYELTGSWTPEQRFKFFKLAISKTKKELLPSTIITDAEGKVLEIMPGLPTVSDVIRLMAD